MVVVEVEILLEDDDADVVGGELVDEGDDLTGAAAQPTEFRNDEGVAGDELFQQFVDAPLSAVLARGDGDGNKFIHAEPLVMSVFQNFQALIFEILFVGGRPNIRDGFAHKIPLYKDNRITAVLLYRMANVAQGKR